MIYTLTLNPSIDYIVKVDQLNLGQVNRMKSDLKLPGGKGINVSRILKRIQVPSIALGFVGGFTGHFIEEELQKEKLQLDFTHIKADTRINVKLKAEEETDINGQGPDLTPFEIEALKTSLQQIKAGDIVILSGSTPSGLKKGFYQELIELIKAKKAEFVIDTTGEDLLASLSSHPLLVKPNNHELADLYHTTFSSIEEIIAHGKLLLNSGAQHVLVSMAGDGALLITNDGVYQSNVLKRPLKNSVGAGDSMVAGFIGTFEQTKDVVEAFRWGVACGSATAFSDDLATGEFIEELLTEVKITKLEEA